MATIAERSRTKEIIDRLQMILDTAPSVPLAAGKVSIYKDEVQSLLSELASQMEIELKTYHEVNDRKGRIISEAKKEAERIIYEAEHTASRMRVSKHTTGVAPLNYDALNEEERYALGNANEIYAASLIYTDEMLTEVTDMISTAYQNIRGDYEIIIQALEDKLNTINSNRMELMTGLQEMDLDDRSQQILEIGQLLSNELYTARMKARMNSDEYEDGSVQLTLDLQEEQEEKTRIAEEKAQRAEEALVKMMEERDALAQKVEMLKNDVKREKEKERLPVSVAKEESKPELVKVKETIQDWDVGIEAEETTEPIDEKEVAEAIEALESLDKEQDKMPVIPHFKKSESVTNHAEKETAETEAAVVSEKKHSGFIGRAVQRREQETMNQTVQMMEDISIREVAVTEEEVKKPEKDEDIRVDANGKEYVQATMVFDDNFEITEF